MWVDISKNALELDLAASTSAGRNSVRSPYIHVRIHEDTEYDLNHSSTGEGIGEEEVYK